MSDILIKGMEMPTMPETFKQGERVPYIDVRIFADGTAVTSKCERPYYTQYSAVPIPPHGRLIDEREAYDKIAEQEGGNYVDMDAVGRGLEETTTVIEASEVE